LQKNAEAIPYYRKLQVLKNRYDGTVGETSLAFNPTNKRYFELTSHERDIFIESEGNIKNLIQSRVNKYGEVEPVLA
jgi:hypothetical protein